jgi:hypothetical protein
MERMIVNHVPGSLPELTIDTDSEVSEHAMLQISDWVDSYIKGLDGSNLKPLTVHRLELAETEGPAGSADQPSSGQPTRHE